jgi:hypothetical protein
MKKKLLSSLVAAAASAVGLGIGASTSMPAFGNDIGISDTNGVAVESEASGAAAYIGHAASGDNPAIVTAILSAPGIGSGAYTKTYSSWAFLANDGTGSIDVFASAASVGSYVPTVGNAVAATGKFAPFDGIPELGSITAISNAGGGAYNVGSLPVADQPTVATIPELSTAQGTFAGGTWGAPPVGTPNPPGGGSAIGEYMFTLNNVMISSGTTTIHDGNPWGLGQSFLAGGTGNSPNMTLTITDESGNHMVLFYWPTSYSTDGAFWGQYIPQNVETDITGFADVFGSGSTAEVEFVPITVTALPEPAPFVMLALGGIMALLRRRRKTA